MDEMPTDAAPAAALVRRRDAYPRAISNPGMALIINNQPWLSAPVTRMLPRIAFLATPLALVALFELCFQLGVWEPFAARYSHAGIGISLKRKLQAPGSPAIDFVTLGSSRPLYGIDHESLAALAKQHGAVHADLSMAGSHWMTIGVFSRWLRKTRPEIRGGIVALSIDDFASSNNGTYELGIVQPFRQIGDFSVVADHVQFATNDPETYGVYSALFEWRKDIQDFLAHPARILTLKQYAQEDRISASLFSNVNSMGDMCNQKPDRPDPCTGLQKAVDDSIDLEMQCHQILDVRRDRPDFNQALDGNPIAESLRRTRTSIQSRLRELRWSVPPLVILMPLPEFSRAASEASGLHRWALEVLRPLIAANEIHLIDATDFFVDSGTNECHYFFDFYHQNAAGRELLDQWLRPRIETWLYSTEHVVEGHDQPKPLAVSHTPIP